MSAEDNDAPPTAISFAQSRQDAQNLLRSITQSVSEANKRKKQIRREREQLNIQQKKRRLEEILQNEAEVGDDFDAAVNDEGVIEENEDFPDIVQIQEEVARRPESDEGYNGSEEGNSAMPDFIRVRNLEETSRDVVKHQLQRDATFKKRLYPSKGITSSCQRMDPQKFMKLKKKKKFVR